MAYTDNNIYARYFTDAVERVNLPVNAQGQLDLTQLPVDPTTGLHYFTLQYNGDAVQQLSITEGAQPFSAGNASLAGTFSFTWNDGVNPVVTASTTYFSGADPNTNAAAMQAVLRGMGVTALSNVTVTASDANDYVINYGPASAGMPINGQLTTSCYDSFGNCTLGSGYFPSVTVTTTREPGTTAEIVVSPTDPTLTAANIQYVFSGTSQNVQSALSSCRRIT